MVKPLLPIVSDWYQHEFNEIEHLSCVHAVYGSHHLQHEIADNGSDNDPDKKQNTLKSEDQVPFHVLVDELKNDLNSFPSELQFNILKSLLLSPVFIAREGPPPKFAYAYSIDRTYNLLF